MNTYEENDARVGFLTRRFSTALNAGDAAALQEAFDPQSIVVTEPGTTMKPYEQEHGGTGFESLEANLGGVLVAEDVAILLVEWTILTRDATSGALHRASGRACDLGRRDADGVWRCLIDNGSGSGPADAPRVLGAPDEALDGLVGNLVQKFRDAANAGDGDRWSSLFESTAVFAVEPGVESTIDARDAAVEAWLNGARLESTVRHAYVADNVAMTVVDWELRHRDGIADSGTSVDVMRRDDDGAWRYAIFNRFGSAPYRDSFEVLAAGK
ncbi:YybH family protein [Nocardia sp. R16R-3T]